MQLLAVKINGKVILQASPSIQQQIVPINNNIIGTSNTNLRAGLPKYRQKSACSLCGHTNCNVEEGVVEKNIVNKSAAVDRCIGIANNLVVDKNVVNKLAGIYANENKFAEDEVCLQLMSCHSHVDQTSHLC
ncbi:hypothetical protein BDC45DRAFT_541173 [Circinella umbellata]|nr:hypothetical protein BDC45DRAFT_541173 [Circinella umbellata]